MAHLVTGHAGIEHIKPSDDGAFNIGICGSGQYVFPIGEQFGYEIISNNLIKIKSGELVNQGRHINIPVNNYEEVTIENGLQGVKRHDIIVMRYERNPDTNIESASIVVLKGTSSTNPNDPSMTLGNIYEGALVSDMPLYKVCLDGLNIEKVESMFTVIPSLSTANAKLDQIVVEDISNEITLHNGTVLYYAKHFMGRVEIKGYIPFELNNNGFKDVLKIPEKYNVSEIIYGEGSSSASSNIPWIVLRPGGAVQAATKSGTIPENTVRFSLSYYTF